MWTVNQIIVLTSLIGASVVISVITYFYILNKYSSKTIHFIKGKNIALNEKIQEENELQN